MRTLLSTFTAVFGVIVATGATQAQDYPARAVTIVVPSSAGAVQDIIARAVGDRLAASTGQAFIVDNKPGASGNIGAVYVKNSEPDGYTLSLQTTTVASYPDLFKSLPYDPLKEMTHLVGIAKGPAVLSAPVSSPANDMKEMVELSKTTEGGVDYATSGIGVIHHQAVEFIRLKTGANFRMIPYNGGGPTLTAITGGQVAFGSLSLATIRPQMEAGKLKALAVIAPERSPLAPDVPSLTDLGLPAIDATIQFQLTGPAGIPAEVTAKLESEVRKALQDPELLKILNNAGLEPSFLTSAEATQAMHDWADTWRPIIQETGMSLE